MLVDEDVYKAYSVDDFIKHHGVKGQKWGIRHPKLKALETFVGNHKKLVIGAAAVAGVLATRNASTLKDAGVLNQKLGKTFVDGVFGGRWKTDFTLAKPGLNDEELMSKVVAPINSDFGRPGTLNNCRRCTFAYELRRRGYDVAATKTHLGTGQDLRGLYNATRLRDDVGLSRTSMAKKVLKESFDTSNAPFSKMMENQFGTPLHGGATDIFETLSKEPEYSRGELSMQWAGTSAGHSMAYEVRGGRAVLIDNQTGKMYKSVADLTAGEVPAIGNAGFTRLDNIQLDEPFLQRWVKNANQ